GNATGGLIYFINSTFGVAAGSGANGTSGTGAPGTGAFGMTTGLLGLRVESPSPTEESLSVC
ncbi:MAG: hypothetical protein K2X29_08165, partial [Candidatus Obscuribacterales bacterium]|nr:hypothetical protein [Candidatus Obscuribacterales bacterium]